MILIIKSLQKLFKKSLKTLFHKNNYLASLQKLSWNSRKIFMCFSKIMKSLSKLSWPSLAKLRSHLETLSRKPCVEATLRSAAVEVSVLTSVPLAGAGGFLHGLRCGTACLRIQVGMWVGSSSESPWASEVRYFLQSCRA